MNHQQRPRDLRIMIRLVTPFVIAGLVAGAVFEYRRATSDLEQRFNDRQAYLARQASDRLSEVFLEVRKFLLLIGQVLDTGPAASGTQGRPSALLSGVVEQLRAHGAVGGWQQGPTGEMVRFTGGPEGALRELAGRLPPCEQRGDLCVHGPLPSSLSRAGRVLVAALSLPEAGDQLAAGTISIVLDWGALQELIGRITKLSSDTYAWVLDGKGRLIMHPDHREQLGEDARKSTSACAICHSSFDVHSRMARGGSGTGRIQVLGGELKLVAYTPVAAGQVRWSLAVATPANQVTRQERGSLLSILLFTGAIAVVMLIGAVLLDQESSRRVRAAAAFNKELAAKVAERTEEIQALYNRLAALQARHTRLERVAVAGEMAAIVAHEIRTPLNALSINAQMVARKLRRGADADREKALEGLGTLDNEIQRINTLLEDHLLALVRHRPQRLEAVDLGEVVSDAVRFMEPEAARAGVELRPSLGSDLPRVSADPAKLRQVLLNIVLNAIQAMPGGGSVFISTAAEDGHGTVTVRDTGPGIANALGDDIEQVFRPFVTTKEDGTGLGLAICGRLVKEMKGKIRVFSKPGDGATFVVSVPMRES